MRSVAVIAVVANTFSECRQMVTEAVLIVIERFLLDKFVSYSKQFKFSGNGRFDALVKGEVV